MLVQNDAHLFQIIKQLDFIKNKAKLTFDLCNLGQDWNYVAGVITNREGVDTDLDVTKMSEGAAAIYTEYFKVPSTKFLS